MSASRWFTVVLVLALAVLTGWFIAQTEWADIEVRKPPQGEALSDPHYAIKKVLTSAGASVHTAETLPTLPPTSTRLVLSAAPWRLFPERMAALRQWVQAGGQVVIDARVVRDDAALSWLGVHARIRSTRAPLSAAMREALRTARTPQAKTVTPASAPECAFAHEAADLPPAWHTRQAFRVCAHAQTLLSTRQPLHWSLARQPAPGSTAPQAMPQPSVQEPSDDNGNNGEEEDEEGEADDSAPHADDHRSNSNSNSHNNNHTPSAPHELLQLAFGQGRITVMDVSLLNNRQALEGDHALMLVAALRLQRGDAVWFFTREDRPALANFLWEKAPPVIVLCALALLLALWRGAVPFGPRLRALPRARRSMAEQIRGTAAFIFAHGGMPLYHAQVRALDKAARRVISQYDSLGLQARAQALAQRTGIEAETLARALTSSHQKRRAIVQASLAVLETARRRLLPHTPRPLSTDSTKDSPP